MISCVFCCKQDSNVYFTFTNKDLLNLWCTEFLKRSFVLKQPFTGFPTCQECMTLHDQVVALNEKVKKYKAKIHTVLDSLKEKVVVSADSNARLNPSIKFDVPWNDKLGENCKILRNALLGKELSQIVIGASLLKHPVNPVAVPPLPTVVPPATITLNTTPTPSLSATNVLQPQTTVQNNNPLQVSAAIVPPTPLTSNMTSTSSLNFTNVLQPPITLQNSSMSVPGVLLPATATPLNFNFNPSLNFTNVLEQQNTLHNNSLPVSAAVVPPTTITPLTSNLTSTSSLNFANVLQPPITLQNGSTMPGVLLPATATPINFNLNPAGLNFTNVLQPQNQITSQIQNLLSYINIAPSLSTTRTTTATPTPVSVSTSVQSIPAPAAPAFKIINLNPTKTQVARDDKTGDNENLLDLNEFDNQNQNISDNLPSPAPDEPQEPDNKSYDSEPEVLSVCLKRQRRNVDDQKDNHDKDVITGTGTKNRKEIVGNYCCEFCSESFTIQNRLVSHLESMHSSEPTIDNLNCFDCHKKFYSMVLLERHVETHEAIYSQQMTCDFCPKTDQPKIRRRFQHMTHIQQAHESKVEEDEKPHGCAKCGKRFMSKLLLSRHFTRHVKLDSTLPLVCEICDVRYPLGCEVQLQDHKREKHFLGEKWKCRICPAIFQNRPNLHRHERELHPVELLVHQCDQCKKKYTREEFLKTHVVAEHTKDAAPAPFKCAACGLSYQVREKLKFHLEVHTGESISTDMLWNKIVRQKGDLSKLTPPGSHPYECKLCRLRFRIKRNLESHEMDCDPKVLRTAQRCTECGKEFEGDGWTVEKRKHQEEVHGDLLKSNTCLCYLCGKTVKKLSLKKHLYICQRSTDDGVNVSVMIKHKQKYKYKNVEKDPRKKVGVKVKTFKECCSCYFCGRRFKERRFLRLHMFFHTKEFTIRCNECGKRFLGWWSLIKHRRDVHNFKIVRGRGKARKEVEEVEATISNVMLMRVEAEVDKAVESILE